MIVVMSVVIDQPLPVAAATSALEAALPMATIERMFTISALQLFTDLCSVLRKPSTPE